jgi:hypothetical protein
MAQMKTGENHQYGPKIWRPIVFVSLSWPENYDTQSFIVVALLSCLTL